MSTLNRSLAIGLVMALMAKEPEPVDPRTPAEVLSDDLKEIQEAADATRPEVFVLRTIDVTYTPFGPVLDVLTSYIVVEVPMFTQEELRMMRRQALDRFNANLRAWCKY